MLKFREVFLQKKETKISYFFVEKSYLNLKYDLKKQGFREILYGER